MILSRKSSFRDRKRHTDRGQVWQGVPKVGYPRAGLGLGTPQLDLAWVSPRLNLSGLPPLAGPGLGTPLQGTPQPGLMGVTQGGVPPWEGLDLAGVHPLAGPGLGTPSSWTWLRYCYVVVNYSTSSTQFSSNNKNVTRSQDAQKSLCKSVFLFSEH